MNQELEDINQADFHLMCLPVGQEEGVKIVNGRIDLSIYCWKDD